MDRFNLPELLAYNSGVLEGELRRCAVERIGLNRGSGADLAAAAG